MGVIVEVEVMVGVWVMVGVDVAVGDAVGVVVRVKVGDGDGVAVLVGRTVAVGVGGSGWVDWQPDKEASTNRPARVFRKKDGIKLPQRF